jgi:hypothetical protein
MRTTGAVLIIGITLTLTASFAAECVGRSPPSQVGPSSGVERVAEATCTSKDGSRTCSCDTKCHSTEDDCECEDD